MELCRRSLTGALFIAVVATAGVAKADDLSKGVPSQEALQKKTALKLAGLVTFVAGSCPAYKVDLDRFKTAIAALGVSTDDLNKQANKFAYLQYTLLYQKDVEANCARAVVEFGPQGRRLPGLLQEVKK